MAKRGRKHTTWTHEKSGEKVDIKIDGDGVFSASFTLVGTGYYLSDPTQRGLEDQLKAHYDRAYEVVWYPAIVIKTGYTDNFFSANRHWIAKKGNNVVFARKDIPGFRRVMDDSERDWLDFSDLTPTTQQPSRTENFGYHMHKDDQQNPLMEVLPDTMRFSDRVITVYPYDETLWNRLYALEQSLESVFDTIRDVMFEESGEDRNTTYTAGDFFHRTNYLVAEIDSFTELGYESLELKDDECVGREPANEYERKYEACPGCGKMFDDDACWNDDHEECKKCAKELEEALEDGE